MMMMLKKEINKFQLRKIALCIRKRRSRACAALGTRIPARFARSDKKVETCKTSSCSGSWREPISGAYWAPDLVVYRQPNENWI